MQRYSSTVFYLFIFILCFSCHKDESERKLIEFVDPFIGTDAHGHCFPGATRPFGGIQLSPDNPRKGWDWCSGYHYSDSIICSFSHTHLSGTGIGDLQDVRLLPVAAKPEKGEGIKEFIQSCYGKFSHQDEHAEPGYYSVKFENGIVTELSTTERCGIHYYQYPDNGVKGLTIDLTTAFNWDKTVDASIKKINNRRIEGYRKSKGWANDQRVYFVIEFSQDINIYAGSDSIFLLENGQKYQSNTCYAWVDFGDNTNKILVKVSLSSANCDGAAANIDKELPHWSFDKVKRDSRSAWRRELSKIKVESECMDELKTFYTAMYHTFLAPYIYSDVNGNYKGPDGEIHSDNSSIQYTVFSLWDTYRAVHPLFTILQRKRVNDMINSMLKHYDAHGVLPVWELVGNETNCMIGHHSISVIAEAYLKGIRQFDTEKAYEAMKNTNASGRDGLKELRRYGYVPCDLINESVSKTLEYAYNDWCIAQMAKALNKENDYLYFLNQSRNYSNLFDKSSGFMRGKTSKGEWKTPFSPLFSRHRNDEYTEGNAWQYSWYVPHDVEGLIALHGGQENFEKKLDSLFSLPSIIEGSEVSPDISGMIGQYAQGNEPSHHIAYLYNYIDKPHKTQLYIDKIRKDFYKATPDGLCGNEDCGQMSAWYIFSAMGFYPVNPAECKYWLGTPLFKKASIKVGTEKTFDIIANKENCNYIYVESILLNGSELKRNWITHDEIMKGGKLEFVLSDICPEN